MPSEILEVPVLAAIVAVVLGLGKIIEVLITRAVPRKSILTDDERAAVKNIDEILSKSDPDGTPLVYVPRSWAEVQKEMQHIMTQIVNDQRRIADILDRMEKKLDK